MPSNEFGVYLRQLRSEKMTQEQLAEATGRNKMTISLIETGRNDPPNGKFLEEIIRALSLSDSEANYLRNLSALKRQELPCDIFDYLVAHPGVFDAIRRGKEQNRTSADWETIFGGKAK